MKILKTMVAIGPETHKVDTIEYEGQWWLVPLWIDLLDEGMTQPLRIISLAAVPHQKLEHYPHAQFAANEPLPKALFETAPVSKELAQQYGVVEKPPIRIRGGSAVN